jgi:putative tryptophan/tyrosine transport system substrate-binding protein
MGALDKLSASREGLGQMTNRKSAQPLRQGGHRIRRRELLFLLVGVTTAPRSPRAQQKAMPVIGYLSSLPRFPGRSPVHQGLSETGYVEGQNLAFEYRWAEGHYDRLPALAADLVSRKVDLIVTYGGSVRALAAKSATSTIPIVFVTGDDPVANGLVASLARPGGNVTGVSFLGVELQPKRLELVCAHMAPFRAASWPLWRSRPLPMDEF